MLPYRKELVIRLDSESAAGLSGLYEQDAAEAGEKGAVGPAATFHLHYHELCWRGRYLAQRGEICEILEEMLSLK
jgi:hypothetical protein